MNSSTISTILMFAVLIGLMYFMMIRPQKKTTAETSRNAW